MQKSKVTRGGRRTSDGRVSQSPNAIEGHIRELCRELAVEAKRMNRLQEQAEELRTVMRRWAGESATPPEPRLG